MAACFHFSVPAIHAITTTHFYAARPKLIFNTWYAISLALPALSKPSSVSGTTTAFLKICVLFDSRDVAVRASAVVASPSICAFVALDLHYLQLDSLLPSPSFDCYGFHRRWDYIITLWFRGWALPFTWMYSLRIVVEPSSFEAWLLISVFTFINLAFQTIHPITT